MDLRAQWLLEASQATGPAYKPVRPCPLHAGLFLGVKQTCRPLLAKIPKTAWERRKFSVDARAIPRKRWGIATENFVEYQLGDFGNFPKTDIN